MLKQLLATVTFLLSASVYAETVVDVNKLAGKSKEQVSLYLGDASSCGASKYGLKCQYDMGQTEIVFIKGKADWITIEGIDHIPFSKSALAALGLNVANPSFSNNFTLRWNSIPGLLEVSIFKAGANSDYAYIKVATP